MLALHQGQFKRRICDSTVLASLRGKKADGIERLGEVLDPVRA